MNSPKPRQISLTIIPCQTIDCATTYAFTELGYPFSALQQRYEHFLQIIGWRKMKHPDGYGPLLICPECVENTAKSLIIKYKKPKKRR
jgi:hypothetical protein